MILMNALTLKDCAFEEVNIPLSICVRTQNFVLCLLLKRRKGGTQSAGGETASISNGATIKKRMCSVLHIYLLCHRGSVIFKVHLLLVFFFFFFSPFPFSRCFTIPF